MEHLLQALSDYHIKLKLSEKWTLYHLKEERCRYIYQQKAYNYNIHPNSSFLILQDSEVKSLEGNFYGLLLGWIMAAIYMGGRLPQIYLNVSNFTQQ